MTRHRVKPVPGLRVGLSDRCPRARCDMRMEPHVDRLGRVVYECAACARNDRGICRDCPCKLVFTSASQRANRSRWPLRCPVCQKRQRAARAMNYYRQNPERKRAIARKTWRKNATPERAARRAQRHQETWPKVKDRVNARRRELHHVRRSAA